MNPPQHIGIILDGNRRWAKREGLNSFQGHKKGIDNMKNIAKAALNIGIKHMTCYCFSTENWKRSPEEVDYLMRIFEQYIQSNLNDFHHQNIRLQHIGTKDRLPKTLANALSTAAEKTRQNTAMTINLAINYGGHDEIMRSIHKIIDQNPHASPPELKEAINTTNINTNLDTNKTPPPDLIIRTSGEQRLSNFLTWQSAYSELFFVKKYFPEFTPADLQQIIQEFHQRNRRFGGS